jgi:hypothetical protein
MPTPAEIILAKVPLPTHLDSTEIRERWTDDVRRRSLFSARTTEIGYLRRLQAVLAQVAGGEINNADARLALLEQLDALGYTPEEGFPGDANRGVPPASGLADLSGRRRLDLIVDTNRQMAASAAMLARQTPAEVEMFPAWRLERYEGRQQPREDWAARWHGAGQAVAWDGAMQSVMVALKSSPIWAALGNGAGGFRDSLGNPYPPFAYSSGLNWSPVSADECRRLGLDTATADAPAASLRPGEKEIADTLARYGEDWTAALMRDLEG